MFESRHVLARMRQGDSDRDIARAGLMGRKKFATIRGAALQHNWLNPARPMPDDAVLAAMFGRNPQLPRTCVSTLGPFRDLITQWFNADIQGTTIHSALQRNHGYAGSYSAVRRFLQALSVECGVKATTVLEFAPADAAQIDFGAGPQLLDASGKPVKMPRVNQDENRVSHPDRRAIISVTCSYIARKAARRCRGAANIGGWCR